MNRFKWTDSEYRLVIQCVLENGSPMQYHRIHFRNRSYHSVKSAVCKIRELIQKCDGNIEKVLELLHAHAKGLLFNPAIDQFLIDNYVNYSNVELSKMIYDAFKVHITNNQIFQRLTFLGYHRKKQSNPKPVIIRHGSTDGSTDYIKDTYKPATFAESVLDRHWNGEKFQRGTKEYKVAKKYNFISY